ncbi:MAG TPA: FG-GAP-like repeat-containing protein [Vicinamibacterales bacterium]|nr:FG-GAP-like repeat-containing protein [Vicinamibacterales bacterium]
MSMLARAAIVIALLAGWASPALATDFTVTKTADTNDGACNGDCSLREAIVAANALAGADRVILGSGLTYTLTRGPADAPGAMVEGTGDLDITGALTIEGNGSTIDAGGSINENLGLDRVLDIEGSFSVTINNLTIAGGVARGFLSLGGGVYIRQATVTFNNCAVVSNRTAVENNSAIEPAARDAGGGIAAVGGFTPGTGAIVLAVITLNSTTVAGNSGASGGGLLCVHCQLWMTNSTVNGNVSASGDGGGAALFGHASTAMVNGGALTGNTAASRGGAFAVPFGDHAEVNITRSRILSNAAATGSGIFNNLTGSAITAVNNWWGCNAGPGLAGAGCAVTANTVSGAATTAPFLVLRGTAAPAAVTAPAQSVFTADLTVNSASADVSAGGTIQNGVPAVFASTQGIFSQATSVTSSGKAAAVFTAGATAGSASLSVTVDNQTVSSPVTISAPALRHTAAADVDGDSLSDLMVWRGPTGTWYWLTSSTGYGSPTALSKQWGNQAAGDVPFLTDIDGDGAADLVLWRASTGTWFWLTSTTGYNYASAGSKQWGNQSLGDVPMVADIDGDQKADLVIWRASTGTFYWLTSTSGYNYANAGSKAWGNQSLGDVPLLGDIDGDRLADLAVWRASTGTWYWLTSSTGYSYASPGSVQWGNLSLGDKPFLADVDGDGAADLLLWRASTGTWYWLTSSTGYAYASAGLKQWGNSSLGDVPLVGDLDADGKADLIVWRASTGTWLWLTSLTGYNYGAAGQRQWGALSAGDVPMIR